MALKETVTFEIDSALLEAARGLKIDLNEFFRSSLSRAVESGQLQPGDEEVAAAFSASLAKYDAVYEHLAK